MIDNLVSLGWGTFSLAREKVEEIFENTLRRGKSRREDFKKFVRELMERGEREKEEWKDYLRNELNKLLMKSELVTRKELSELEKRLEQRIEALEREKQNF